MLHGYNMSSLEISIRDISTPQLSELEYTSEIQNKCSQILDSCSTSGLQFL